MRKPRLKPREATWHHIIVRAAGGPKDRLFGNKERKALRKILKAHTVYYTVQLIAFNLLSNHFLCGAPHKKCYVKSGIM
jgi:REP element-mobilizing transposase RayT